MQMVKSIERRGLVLSANSYDGPPPSKRHCEFDDSSAKDAKPKIRKINEVLVVELLEMIVRCVPTKRTGIAPLQDELSNIPITRQFQLRYLCRLWRSIVYRNTKLTLSLLRCGSRFRFTPQISVRPAGFKFEETAGLLEAMACSAGQAVADSSWTDRITCVRVYWNGEQNDESTISVLTRLTKSIRHPVSLDLTLPIANITGAIKHCFRIPFATRFPNLMVSKLDLYSIHHFIDRKKFIYSARLTEFYLKSAINHLTELHVSLFTLDRALTGFRARHNGVNSIEPWTCNSVRRLKLWLSSVDDFKYSDLNSVTTRTAAFAVQAKLPAWFPQLKQLKLDWWWNLLQFDFTVLQKFALLENLSLLSWFSEDLVQDCLLHSLPNIQTFALRGWVVFPMDLALFVPNVCALKIVSLKRRTCRHLTRQLSLIANALPKLRELSLECSRNEPYPICQDVHDLLSALKCAPHLAMLEVKNICPPDDLGLLSFIPENVVKLTLDCCLMPDWVGFDYVDGKERWFVWQERATRLELHEMYKKWIRDLLGRLADIPELKEFYCVLPTPNFRTARSLTSEWSRDVSKLVADLKLDSLKNIVFDPVDSLTKCVGFTATLLASGGTPKSLRQYVARIVFKDADYITR